VFPGGRKRARENERYCLRREIGGRPMSSFETRACRYGGFTLLGHASSDSRSVTERPFVFPLVRWRPPIKRTSEFPRTLWTKWGLAKGAKGAALPSDFRLGPRSPGFCQFAMQSGWRGRAR
jgi:hypothetical protein